MREWAPLIPSLSFRGFLSVSKFPTWKVNNLGLKTKVSWLWIFFVLHEQESIAEAGVLLPSLSHCILHTMATVRFGEVHVTLCLNSSPLRVKPEFFLMAWKSFMTWKLPVFLRAPPMGHPVRLALVTSLCVLALPVLLHEMVYPLCLQWLILPCLRYHLFQETFQDLYYRLFFLGSSSENMKL